MRKSIAALFLLFTLYPVYSQTTGADTLRKDALNVFMTTTDYIRKEIPYINYVRDIRDAHVYVISTTQRTGSGGREYSYFLNGQKEYSGMNDTISFVTSPDDTEEEVRQKEVKTLKMALMRYISKTPLSQYISISFTEPLSETVSTDKWNSWVFKASLSGWLDAQQTYGQTNIYGDISAARITEDLKINLRSRYNLGIQKFEIDDEIISSENNSKSLSALIVGSVSDHWSIGGTVKAGSSSFRNEQFSLTLMPGIEYDLYPYSESTRRQLRLLYSAGYTYCAYIDTTIYDKKKEAHLMHSFDIAYEVVQKWGTIDLSLNYSNFLHDWSKNNLSLNGYLNFRIARGLSVNFGGGASLIHDQLGLVKGGATTEEILLQRKELATQYQYFTSFGLTYTFGSIYNNVVNPRFGNSGGGGMTIIMN